ncbi:hypothetical protein WOB59_01765 [Methylocystis sp. IM4]|uniref:hypothetical protein n=1 Tax=Methylocystis sp. IM4 TaxID=3136560 RepID=UPI0031196A08
MKTETETIRTVCRFARCTETLLFAMALGGLLIGMTGPLSAETLRSSLARAYAGNPDLNQSRAAVRVRDEDAPKALAGMRPKANIQASAGPQYANLRFPGGAIRIPGSANTPSRNTRGGRAARP